MKCTNYTIQALRSSYESYSKIEQEIHDSINQAAKNLIDGKSFDIDSMAGLFRAHERIRERYEGAVESYENHQERHECEIPADLEGAF